MLPDVVAGEKTRYGDAVFKLSARDPVVARSISLFAPKSPMPIPYNCCSLRAPPSFVAVEMEPNSDPPVQEGQSCSFGSDGQGSSGVFSGDDDGAKQLHLRQRLQIRLGGGPLPCCRRPIPFLMIERVAAGDSYQFFRSTSSSTELEQTILAVALNFCNQPHNF